MGIYICTEGIPSSTFRDEVLPSSGWNGDVQVMTFTTIVQGGPKKCPTFSESSGISLQIQDDISIKWGIFLVHPVVHRGGSVNN